MPFDQEIIAAVKEMLRGRSDAIDVPPSETEAYAGSTSNMPEIDPRELQATTNPEEYGGLPNLIKAMYSGKINDNPASPETTYGYGGMESLADFMLREKAGNAQIPYVDILKGIQDNKQGVPPPIRPVPGGRL